jgi:large subunit ribosomal protein L9
MKVILLKDIPKVGKKYEVKNIADGYALNLLIPKKLAIIATPEAVKKVEKDRAIEEGDRKVRADLISKNLASLDGKKISIIEKANDKGHLFAGIHKLEIIPHIESQTGIQIDPEYILLNKSIKEIGEHEIHLQSGENRARITLEVKRG